MKKTKDAGTTINDHAKELENKTYKCSQEVSKLIDVAIFKQSTAVIAYIADGNSYINDRDSEYVESLKTLMSKSGASLKIVSDTPLNFASKIQVAMAANLTKIKPVISNPTPSLIDAVKSMSITGDKFYFVIGDDDKFKIQYVGDDAPVYYSFNDKLIVEKLMNCINAN